MIKVAFLTEGGGKSGFGHLSRCLALAQAFSFSGSVKIKFLVDAGKAAAAFLKKDSFAVVKTSWLRSPDDVFRQAHGWQIVIIDSYRAPASFYRKIHGLKGGPFVVAIDDYNRLNYRVDLLIKPSLLKVKEKSGFRSGSVPCLAGWEYAILRKDFQKRCLAKKVTKIKRLLVTLGGQDIHNLTPRILDLLNCKFPLWTKFVIVGQGFSNLKEIKKRQAKNVYIFSGLSAQAMRKVMLKSDAAISAGGQTLNELASTGTPAVVIGIAGNQINNIKGFQRAGFIEYAGWWKAKNLMWALEKALYRIDNRALLKKRIGIGRRLIDGQGARRLAKQILELEQSER